MILKYVFRNVRRFPFLNGIKVLGLALALSSLLLILLFLKYKLTYDGYHSRADDIYRISITNPDFLDGKHFARIYGARFIPDLKESFSAIENFVRLAPVKGGGMKYGDQFFTLAQGFESDSTFFDVFDAEFLIGDKDEALKDPGTMVISRSYARMIFGEKNPIGEILSIPAGQYYGEDTEYIISGIMQDFPGNSHFHPDFVACPRDRTRLDGWAWTYLLFHSNADIAPVRDGFKQFYSSFFELNEEANVKAHFQALKDIHLHSQKTREIESNSNMKVVFSFSLSGILLLLIALINYSNLNSGMAVFTEKFLFLNKIFGASGRAQLRYFIFENILIGILVLLLSAVLSIVGLILINSWSLLDLWKGNLFFIILILFVFMLLQFASGVLPLLMRLGREGLIVQDLSRLGKSGRIGINKVLLIIQNVISIALIVAVISIQKQTTFALEKRMSGGDNELICFEDVHTDVQQQFIEFKDELLRYHSIEDVTAMFEPPGGEANDMFVFTMEGYVPDEAEEINNRIGIFPCDYSFASVFNLDFIAGQNFTREYSDNEGSGEYLINESAMYRLNHSDPMEIVGKDFSLIFGDGESIKIPSGKIIGVVKDFHHSSLKREVEPLVFFKRDALWLMNFVVSFKPGLEEEGFGHLKSTWENMFPEYPFQPVYVDLMYKKVYADELLQSKLLFVLTLIALVVISMGLLGLSLLTSQQRIKELGVRRVHGAETLQILWMLNWSYLKWILLAYILAVPISYYLMSSWLAGYVYRTELSWWIFALAGLIAIAMSFFTLLFQTWKVAKRNPVEALRYE